HTDNNTDVQVGSSSKMEINMQDIYPSSFIQQVSSHLKDTQSWVDEVNNQVANKPNTLSTIDSNIRTIKNSRTL
ncbi:112_t:CDS:1, partial [Acaulospora colombiana]